MSRFEHGQTAVHFAINRQRHDILAVLIELGADLEGKDLSGRTPLEAAMLRGDAEAMRRLHDARATAPRVQPVPDFHARMSALGSSVTKGVPMIYVPDVAGALERTRRSRFRELARFDEDGLVNFGIVAFGHAELTLNMHGKPAPHDMSLWFYTDQVDALYDGLKSRRIEAADAAAYWNAPSNTLASCSSRTSRTCSTARVSSVSAI